MDIWSLFEPSPETQVANWMYWRRSEDVLASSERLMYVQFTPCVCGNAIFLDYYSLNYWPGRYKLLWIGIKCKKMKKDLFQMTDKKLHLLFHLCDTLIICKVITCLCSLVAWSLLMYTIFFKVKWCASAMLAGLIWSTRFEMALAWPKCKRMVKDSYFLIY